MRPSDRVVVVGSGVAGMQTALQVADAGRPVVLIGKDSWRRTNTYHAQGGVAAALGERDHAEFHAEDTLAVARGLADPEAVAVLVEEAAAALAPLIQDGVFARGDGGLDFSQEAGHRAARIVHAGDGMTGRAVAGWLYARVSGHPRITTMSGRVVRLLVEDGGVGGLGVYVGGRFRVLPARDVVLATGGYAGLYRTTSNPYPTAGDGLWLAWEAGAVLADLEFVQFHPTILDDGDSAEPLLLTEALRGAGARLVTDAGERIMASHPDQELAPRDEVARAVFAARAAAPGRVVYLTMAHLDPRATTRQFPALAAMLARRGFDLARDRIPVRPAAHFTMGGVKVDTDGRTGIDGLWAVGEVSCTGVHGANRLASNSLLEGLVFGRRVGQAIVRASRPPCRWSQAAVEPGGGFGPPPAWLGDLLDQEVGVVRHGEGLARAARRLATSFAGPAEVLAALMVRAAMMRTESRGAHVRADYPGTGNEWRGHIYHRRDRGSWYEPVSDSRSARTEGMMRA